MMDSHALPPPRAHVHALHALPPQPLHRRPFTRASSSLDSPAPARSRSEANADAQSQGQLQANSHSRPKAQQRSPSRDPSHSRSRSSSRSHSGSSSPSSSRSPSPSPSPSRSPSRPRTSLSYASSRASHSTHSHSHSDHSDSDPTPATSPGSQPPSRPASIYLPERDHERAGREGGRPRLRSQHAPDPPPASLSQPPPPPALAFAPAPAAAPHALPQLAYLAPHSSSLHPSSHQPRDSIASVHLNDPNYSLPPSSASTFPNAHGNGNGLPSTPSACVVALRDMGLSGVGGVSGERDRERAGDGDADGEGEGEGEGDAHTHAETDKSAPPSMTSSGLGLGLGLGLGMDMSHALGLGLDVREGKLSSDEGADVLALPLDLNDLELDPSSSDYLALGGLGLELDPNWDPADGDSAHWAGGGMGVEDDSPYAEVRASVSNTDDPGMPCDTFRMWFLGVFFTVVISGVNQFFSLRYPSIQITSLLAQLLALPLGKVMERVLPVRVFRLQVWGWRKGWREVTWTFNPGPFNIKEHTLISVMANVVAGGAYATEIVAAQRTYYMQNWDVGYQLCLVISTQLMGFSLAGICRRFLVWPASMIWPQQLVSCAVLNTLHSTWGFADGLLSRWKFFWLCLAGAFAWYWVPGYLFTGLSTFSYVCWAAPANVPLNQLFGTQTGLGMGVLTFDWSEIAYVNNPLVSPWWAEANVLLGLGIWFWVLTPIIYYKNIFYSAYLPMSTGNGYDNTARIYNVTRVIANGAFNVTAYEEYSPLFITATFAIDYGVQFATLTGTIVHTLLWYREDIIRQFRASLRDEPDVHSRLMSVYREVPSTWYICIGVLSLALGLLTIEHWDTQLPVWAYFLSLLIPIIYVIPLGILQAITNQQIGLNVVTELIVGYALPGKPIAMMIFKTFGYITMTQALSFVGDLKFGHYMKVPPRIMFMAQTIAAFIACFVVVFVQIWMFGNIQGLCQPGQPDGFTCPAIHVFATASVIFGGVGPQRLFSPGTTYGPLMWFFLLGAVLPVPFYFLARRYPSSWFRYVNIPIIFAGTSYLPPATGINYSSWGLVGFVFQYLVRRKRFMWWSRYNYILSAALDGGTVIAGIVIFFVLFLPYSSQGLNWWGNTVSDNTADGRAMPLYQLGGDNPKWFGPETWA